MKKLLFLALMLLGGMTAQAQDVLVGIYDTDKTAVEDEAIRGTKTVETKTTVVETLNLNTSVTDADVMEVTSEEPLDKVVIKNGDTNEVLRTIDLAKAKAAAVDLKPYEGKIVITFFSVDGKSTDYTWE